MTPHTIQKNITRAIQLKRQIADLDAELKDIKAALTLEAESRTEEHEVTEGDGWSWTQPDGEGNIVRVTQPGRKLKSTLNPEAKGFDKIKEVAGRAWSFLFVQVPAYKPKEDFRTLAATHLGRDAQKLIKLVTTDSDVKVSFEVAESEAA
jgi:hypothetical protein